MPLDYAAIGGRLQARRKELGITQEDAAERAGITVVYLSKIENGRVHPTLDLLDRSGRISFAKRQRDMVCRCLVE